jgi:hypothetical protein
MAALLFFNICLPLSAQSLSLTSDGLADASPMRAQLPGTYEVPAVQSVPSTSPASRPVYASQEDCNLDVKTAPAEKVANVVDLSMLNEASVYRKIAVSARKRQIYTVDGESLGKGIAQMAATYRPSGNPEAATDGAAVALSVEQQVRLDRSKLVEIVQTEITANPGSACEIMKAAIHASSAKIGEVATLAETAINASPENMRLIAQCCIAALPESVQTIQALLAKLDPNTGDSGSSAKSSKSAKSAKGEVAAVSSVGLPAVPNPLDTLPIRLIFAPPIVVPERPIIVQPMTDVNPRAVSVVISAPTAYSYNP